jgi:DNA excision repair protein ERCC-2
VAFCPTCRGILRPNKGVLECLRCSEGRRARTIVAKGKRTQLAEGQAALIAPQEKARADGPLAPRSTDWKPKGGGAPHPELGLFPHDTIRDGQKRFARDVTMAVRGGRHLVANAPTGIGKTAASLAPALEHAIENQRTVLFLTSRQSQHRIAVETLRDIRERRGQAFTLVDLVAKRDMCLRHEAADLHAARFSDFCARETRTKSCQYLGDVDAATLQRVRQGVLHVEELMQASKEAMLCPHIVAMEAAKQAHVVVADYNHLFSDLRERSLERLGVRLEDLVVIVDEAHNLPDRVRQNHRHRIGQGLLDRVEEEARQHKVPEVQGDIRALAATLQELANAAIKEDRVRDGRGPSKTALIQVEALHQAFEKQRNKNTLGLSRTLADVVDDLNRLAGLAKKGSDEPVASDQLRDALDDWGRFRDSALRYLEWDEGIELHVRLLDPAVAVKLVFDRIHSAILMSGTLEPPEMFRDVLGLADLRTTVRRYESPFPPGNRFIVVGKTQTTRFKDRSAATYRAFAASIGELAGATRGNVAVFFPSYQLLRDIRDALPELHKETIEEDPGMGKAERDRVLDQLAGARKRQGALLLGVLGGSFAEGIDYRDNLLSAIAVVGLPLAPPDLEVDATVDQLERRFPGKGRLYGYIYPAMQKVLQAVGRGIRGPEDKVAVLLLDARFLQPPYRQILPDLVASDDPVFTAASFLQAHGL